jgi:hypothetical protein
MPIKMQNIVEMLNLIDEEWKYDGALRHLAGLLKTLPCVQ